DRRGWAPTTGEGERAEAEEEESSSAVVCSCAQPCRNARPLEGRTLVTTRDFHQSGLPMRSSATAAGGRRPRCAFGGALAVTDPTFAWGCVAGPASAGRS